MKRLFLVRHAKSSWDDPGCADHDRPLADRGERDAPRMAARLRARLAPPSAIVASSAARALRTAQIFAATLELPPASIVTEPALYHAEPAAILRVAANAGGARPSLLVVGHNPGLTDLVNRILPDLRLDNLPTAGIVVADFATDDWRTIDRTRAVLAYYDYPKNDGEPITS